MKHAARQARQSLGVTLLTVLLTTLFVAAPAAAQGQKEIGTIAVMARELIAQRQAQAAEDALANAQDPQTAQDPQQPASQPEPLDDAQEAARLRNAIQDYLGVARKSASKLLREKLEEADGKQTEYLRRQARIALDQAEDEKAVRDKLDPLFEQLAQLVSLTPEQLLEGDPGLATLRGRVLTGANDTEWVDRAAIRYAMCTNDDEARVIFRNVTLRPELSKAEADAIDETNRRRMVLGLNPLMIDIRLVKCGRDHSSDMIEHGFFGHESPIEGKTKFTDRAKRFDTTASAENIADGYTDGADLIDGWWHSPGHLKVMMYRGHQRIGVGQEQRHFTQLFGR